MEFRKELYFIGCLLTLSLLKVDVKASTCEADYEKDGCYSPALEHVLIEKKEYNTDYQKLSCDCGEAVKIENEKAGRNKYSGFALQTDWGLNWVCSAVTSDERNSLEKSESCVSLSISAPCSDSDPFCVGKKDSKSVFLFKLKFQSTNSLNVCNRNYAKIGCYDEYNPRKEDLLIFDRYNIQWKNIEAYMHHLACNCNEATRAANRQAGEMKYAGFALHYYGECYGKTQADFDRLKTKHQSPRCTGDGSYNGCSEEHKECLGHASSEFIYKLA